MRLRLCLLVALLSMPAAEAADIDALYVALETSDTPAVERYVTDHYREAGISVNDTLTWEHQRFDEVVNWYNQYTEVIMLSELPRSAEVAPYWQNWAEVLTQGNWDWRKFFADDAEAALMANFNQFLVAAHEYGHALTYRYDPTHEERYGYEVNCREYLADRLASALLEEVAGADSRFAALKLRYRALIDEINAHIDPQYRYEMPSFAALDADCRVLHVEQPTEDSMTPYVSAFFVRHALLQAADLPPLAEVYATHLFPFWRERQPPSSGLAGPVTTGATLTPELDVTPGGLSYERRDLAFAPDGTLYIIESGADPDVEPPQVRFSYGALGETVEVAIPARDLAGVRLGEFRLLNFSGFVSLGPDRFAAISGGSGLGSMPILLFDVQRRGGLWSLNVVDLEPDMEVAAAITQVGLVRNPAGTLYAYLSDYRANEESRWRRLELDPVSLRPIATSYVAYPDGTHPVAMGPAGETYFFEDYRVVSVTDDGTVRTVAGAGLQGFKDNPDPVLAEFALEDSVIHLRPDGGMDALDYNPATRSFVLRHIAAAQ